MTSRQLAQVGLGLIGVWALLDALRIFAGVASMGDAAPQGRYILVVAMPLALLLGFSYVLVFRSGQLVSTIAPDAQSAAKHDSHDLPRILVMLLGVWLLVQATPVIVNQILAFVVAGEFPEAQQRAVISRALIGYAIQVAIALFLIMRPERLLAYARRQLPESAA